MTELADRLHHTWVAQAASGFLLADPDAEIETKYAPDPLTGVTFRFRWLPHRRIRGDTAELERRGILSADRGEARLFRDRRDSPGRHCFLCPANVAICHPKEILVPLEAGGRRWVAGVNFAWLGQEHFTVMSADHVDQDYDSAVLAAMYDLHESTGGRYRIVFNGAGAGATIPWHLHLQIVADPLPVEGLRRGSEGAYPIPVQRYSGEAGSEHVDSAVSGWLSRDPHNHRVNVLLTPSAAGPVVFVVLRDARRAYSSNKGLMGGFEVGGDFAYCDHRDDFETADLDTARAALHQINPLDS